MTAPKKVVRPASVIGVVLTMLLLASCDAIDRPDITPTATVTVPALPTPTFTRPARAPR